MTYTINLTISPNRNIYLSRHGESQFNLDDRIGGDPNLSEAGMKYARVLPKIIGELITDPQ
jgi:6-phosphofructo-2-kinase/fructose-2,6-biphosphatase 2